MPHLWFLKFHYRHLGWVMLLDLAIRFCEMPNLTTPASLRQLLIRSLTLNEKNIQTKYFMHTFREFSAIILHIKKEKCII